MLWLAATVLFGLYVANFANYNATYGSLGAVVVLLMWLWVSAYAILFGAELNAEAERQTGVQIGRAHVCTPVTNAHLVCRLLLDKQKRLLWTTNVRANPPM